MASVIDLDRVRRNDDRLSTLQLILSGTVDLDALKEVLRVNTKVAEVIIYVDESFLVELPLPETHDLFRTIGGMPNLQKLGFHSQSGSSGVLSVQALIAITSHATRMVHFGISDVALWGSRADFSLWATQLQTQLFLQSFCVCECELLEPSKDCPLDPLLTVLSILPSLEALFLQAAAPSGLGELSPEAVGSIGMAPQLQDLRLGNFALHHAHMVQMAHVLPYNTVLSELKLDACREFHLETAHALARILRHNTRLKSLELGMTSMMTDECAVVVARSLQHNTALESFTLSRCARARFRPTISKICQRAFVEMLHQNYALETLVLFQRFPVKKEFKLYLTLNKYGRGKLLMAHETQRADWVTAIHKVSDDLDSIFYYLSINPNLCRHCDDDDDLVEDDAVEGEDPRTEEWIQADHNSTIMSGNILLTSSMNGGVKRSAPAAVLPQLEAIEYLRHRSCTAASSTSSSSSTAEASSKRARTTEQQQHDSDLAAFAAAAVAVMVPHQEQQAVAAHYHHQEQQAVAAHHHHHQEQAVADTVALAAVALQQHQLQTQQQQQQHLPQHLDAQTLQQQLVAALFPSLQIPHLQQLFLQHHQQQQQRPGSPPGAAVAAVAGLPQLALAEDPAAGRAPFIFGRPGL